MGSGTAFRLAWATRSVTVGIPSFRNFPVFLPLGIITCRTSAGWYPPDFSESRSRARNSSSPPSRALIWATVIPSMPAVLAPALEATRPKACTRNAGSQTRLNRSPKQRERSSPAQRCNLVCILCTAKKAVTERGHSAAPVFTGASSDITFPPLTDTLPPFPMYAAFPRSEYYGGSAPPAPSAGVAPIRARPSWQEGGRGTHADGSHVHCRPVDGLGTRLCPCGIASGYFAVIRPGLRERPCRPIPEFPARHEEQVRTATPARIHRVRAGHKSRGVTQPVPRVYLSVSLTAPGPSGSAEPARLCRGCSRPPRRPPDQASSSFTPPPRRRGNGRSLTSIRKRQRPVAHAGSYEVTRAAGQRLGRGRPTDR